MAQFPGKVGHVRTRALLASVVLIVTAACGNQATLTTPTVTPIPTANPLTTLPEPIIVVAALAASPTPEPEPTEPNKTYVVVAGDVLGSIAERFRVTTGELRALNGLQEDTIRSGETLKIPPPSAPPPPVADGITTYEVTEGDTAFGIALEFDTTVEALERANGVEDGGLDNLQLRQIVKLPPPGQR